MRRGVLLPLFVLVCWSACPSILNNSFLNNPLASGGSLQGWYTANATLGVCGDRPAAKFGVLKLYSVGSSTAYLYQPVATVTGMNYKLNCDFYDYDDADLSVSWGTQPLNRQNTYAGFPVDGKFKQWVTVGGSFTAVSPRTNVLIYSTRVCLRRCYLEPGTCVTPLAPIVNITPSNTWLFVNVSSISLPLVRCILYIDNVTQHYSSPAVFWNAANTSTRLVRQQTLSTDISGGGSIGGETPTFALFNFSAISGDTRYNLDCAFGNTSDPVSSSSNISGDAIRTLKGCDVNTCPFAPLSQCINTMSGGNYFCTPWLDGVFLASQSSQCRHLMSGNNPTAVSSANLTSSQGNDTLVVCFGVGSSAYIGNFSHLIKISVGSYDCNIQKVNNMNDGYVNVTCITTPGVGSLLPVTASFSPPNTPSTIIKGVEIVSYPLPIIISNTLRFFPSSNRSSSLILTSSDSVLIAFDVLNIAPSSPYLQVWYGINASPLLFACNINPSLSNFSSVTCLTSSSTAYNVEPYKFVVVTDNVNVRGNDTLQLVASAPRISSLNSSSCNQNQGGLINCPTDGGSLLTVNGWNFAVNTSTIRVLIDSAACPVVSTTAGQGSPPTTPDSITCTLPPGTGYGRSVFVQTNAILTPPISLLSFAPPQITGLCGCDTQCSQNLNSTVFTLSNCARSGGSLITVYGNFFGLQGATVLVGAALCTNVTHDRAYPNTRLSCFLPPGYSSTTLIVAQQNGPNSVNSPLANIIYQPCPPGMYQLDSFTTCTNCSAGSYSPLPGQLTCLTCSPGSYSSEDGESFCTPCDIGAYQQYDNMTLCEACDIGRFASNTGQSVCMQCSPGTYFNETRGTGCNSCEVGSYQPILGQSYCELCSVGTFASSISQTICRTCATGWVASMGAESCTMCPTGSYASDPQTCLPCNPSVTGVGCDPCAPGKYWNGSSCDACLAGTYSNIAGSSACLPCAPGWVQPASLQTSCYICTATTYAKSASEQCTSCPRNAQGVRNTEEGNFTDGYTLCQCEVGFYAVPPSLLTTLPSDILASLKQALVSAIDPSQQMFSCVPCPQGANCLSAGTTLESVRPLENYAVDIDNSSLMFYSCLSSQICTPNGCAEGYTGGLCSNCADGYGKRTSGSVCSLCPPSTDAIVQVVGLNVLMVLMLTLYVYRLRVTGLVAMDKHMIAVKVLFTGLQVNSFVLNMRLEMPVYFRNLFTMQNGVSQIGETFLSVDCVSQHNPPLVYQQALLYLLSPFFVVLGSLLISSCAVVIQKIRKVQIEKSWCLIRDYTTSATVLLLTLLHPSMALKSFSLFHCNYMGITSEKYLVADPSIVCYSEEHMQWLGGVAIPLLLLVITIPLGICSYLFHNRAKLAEEEFLLKWAFIYKGYQKQLWCFWEVLVMIKKVLLVAIFVFLTGQIQYQALLAMLLCGIALSLHLWFHPFPSRLLHRLEFVSLTTSSLLYFFVQFLGPLSQDPQVQDASISLIFISQLAFIAIALIVIGSGVFRKVKKIRTEVLARKSLARGESTMISTGGFPLEEISTTPRASQAETGPPPLWEESLTCKNPLAGAQK